tara:strand:+ start:1729 stop:2736 length:1008 start_codon:yes stop_codon:yes gene_type:complete
MLKWLGIFVSTGLSLFLVTGIYFDQSREVIESRHSVPESRFFEGSDGSRIHFLDQGNREHPAIIFLHGFNGSVFNFDRLVPLLSANFRLISIDLPGFGLTGAVSSGEYSNEVFMSTVSHVADYLGIDEFSVAGNSMGGGVAWKYALKYPERIDSLILIASTGTGKRYDNASVSAKSSSSPIAWKLIPVGFLKDFLALYTPRFFATQGLKTVFYNQDLATGKLASQYHELVLMEGSREAILSMFSAQRFKDLSRSTSPEVLSRIDVPTLVIHGKEDRIINYKSSEIFKDHIPIVVTKIYSETGHLPMYEVPERVAKDITDFFSEHLPHRSVLLNKD